MRTSILVLLVLLSSQTVAGAAASGTLSKVWVSLPRSASPVVIHRYATAPAPNERALARRQLRGRPDRVAVLRRGPDPLALRELERQGVEILYVSRLLSAASVRADGPQLAELLHVYGADRVRPVRRWRRPPVETSMRPRVERSGLGKAGGLDYGSSLEQNAQIEVDQLHALGFSGRGVRALVLDTGFLTNHEALDHLPIVAEHDFVFDDAVTANEVEDVASQQNHGTGVLAIMAGRAPGELIGPAYGVEVVLGKTERVDSETRVEEDHFVAALEWGEALGVDIVSASLGYLSFPDEPDTFSYELADLDGDSAVTTRAMDEIVALGVVALSAVGNFGSRGTSSLMTPSDGDSVLAVGSVAPDSTVSFFSSRGPTVDGRTKPDLMARGRLTTWAQASGGFAEVNGTSASTPLVAGAVALLLEAHPDWGPGDVAAALRATATESQDPDNEHGWGIVRSYRAAMEFEAPVHPFPFDLLAPADSASIVQLPVEFRWRRAVDLQSPSQLTYAVEISTDGSFAAVEAEHSAGTDSLRSLSALPAGDIRWRVRVTDPQGHVRRSVSRHLNVQAVTAAPGAAGADWFTVSAPHPNPFNPRVSVDLRLAHGGRVWGSIHDLAGREVLELPVRTLPAGPSRWVWEGIDRRGRRVSSGVYLLRMVAESSSGTRESATRRLVLVR